MAGGGPPGRAEARRARPRRGGRRRRRTGANLDDFYRFAPADIAAAAVLHTTRQTIEDAVPRHTDLGVNEIIFLPATDDLDDVSRLAGIVA